jgi:hypothetical protein
MNLIQPSSASEWLIEVARGNVDGASRQAFGGYTTNIPVSTERLIWNAGGVYTELSASTTLYVSSDNNTDDATIIGIGLDADYNQIVATSTLSGYSQVAFSSDFLRFFIAGTLGPNQSDGNIYVAELDATISNGVPQDQTKIKAKLDADKRQSWSALYTIPTGKTGRFVDFKATSTKAKNVSVSFRGKAQTDGDNWAYPPPFDVYESYHFLPWQLTFSIPEKTDIQFMAESEDADSKILILADMILFDN